MITKSSSDKSRACLFSVGTNEDALLALAKYFPDECGSTMELIVAGGDMLPLLNKRHNFSKHNALRLCVAYPKYASAILDQIIILDDDAEQPFNLSLSAAKAFKLLRDTDSDYLSYHNFVVTFPDESKEIFEKMLVDDSFFCHCAGFYKTMKKMLNQLPQYRARLVGKLIEQSDAFWSKEFSDTWCFAYMAEECPEQSDALFNRYFKVPGLYKEQYHFEGADERLSQLLNLTLEHDNQGRNTFGIITLKILVKLYPEHRVSFIRMLCENPEALNQLLADRPFEILNLIELAPESKEALLAAMKKIKPCPGLAGLLTHGVVDASSLSHTWWDVEGLIGLSGHFTAQTKPFLDILFTDVHVLAKVFSNEYIAVRSAFKLAHQFPQLREAIIAAFWYGKDDTQKVRITTAQIMSAPEELRPVLTLMREIKPGSEYGNEYVLYALLQAPALLTQATQYLEDNPAEAPKNIYPEYFPKEILPWLNIVLNPQNFREGSGYIDQICSLFPENATNLIHFFLRNETFCVVVFDSFDNIIAAARYAPELHRELIGTIKEFGSYHIDRMKALFSAFPGSEEFIIETIFNNKSHFSEFVSVSSRALYEFSNEFPQFQGALVAALQRFPEVFNRALYNGEDIYPLFLLFRGRALLCGTFCQDAPRSALMLSDLSDTQRAVHVLPNFVTYFINFLFSVPDYDRTYCRHDMYFNTTSKLLGHETQIISLLCGNPNLIKFLEHVIADEKAKYDCPTDYRELIFLSSMLCSAVLENSVDSIKFINDMIREQFRNSVIRHPQIRCLVKLTEFILARRSDGEPIHNELMTLRHELLKIAIPKLKFFCAQVVRSSNPDVAVVSSLPLDIQSLLAEQKH